MDAIQLVPKSYPTGERRQKDKSREVNYSGSRGIRIHWLSLACRLLNQQYHTSWAGRCAAVRKVRSFWFQARVSRSYRRSHLVCDWWNVPGAEHLKGIKELGVCYLPGLGRGLPRLRSHRSPNLCWSPGCCPSRQPEGKQSSSRAQSLVFADKEGIWRHQTHQAVLLPVIQPVARPACADDPLQLVGFHPDDLVDSFVSEKGNKVKSREIWSPWAW